LLTETLDIVLTTKMLGAPISGALGLSLVSLMVNPRLIVSTIGTIASAVKYTRTLIPVSCIWQLNHSQYRLQKLSHSKYYMFNRSFKNIDQEWGT